MVLDALFTNGLFHTQDSARPSATAIGVHGGRIVSLADELDPALFDQVYDLRGEEAVLGYTCGSAYAVGQEQDKVMLRTGRLADFVVLSDDLFEVPASSINAVTVGTTVIGGEAVFNDGAL